MKIKLILLAIILILIIFSIIITSNFGIIKDILYIGEDEYLIVYKPKLVKGYLSILESKLFNVIHEELSYSFSLKKNGNVIFHHNGVGRKLVYSNEKLFLFYSEYLSDSKISMVELSLKNNKILSQRVLPENIVTDFFIYDKINNQMIFVGNAKDLKIFFLSFDDLSLKGVDIGEYGYFYSMDIDDNAFYGYFINYNVSGEKKKFYSKYCLVNLENQRIILKDNIKVPENIVVEFGLTRFYRNNGEKEVFINGSIKKNYTTILKDSDSFVLVNQIINDKIVEIYRSNNLQYMEAFNGFIIFIADGKIMRFDYSQSNYSVDYIGEIDPCFNINGVTLKSNDMVLFGSIGRGDYRYPLQFRKLFSLNGI